MGEKTPPRGIPDLNCRFVDVWLMNAVYVMRPLMQSAMYLSMVCGMFVCVSLYVNVCTSTVSNALLMSNTTAMYSACGRNGLVEICCDSAVACGVFGFEPASCCDVWHVLCYVWKNHLLMCFFEITDRRDIGLHDVPMLSGPAELLFLLILIAALTCSVVMFI